MFSLIIAIVSIALIVALVALGGYFGGDVVSDAQAKTQAARLVSEERQILASMDMFQADNKRWPTNLEELLTTGYLRSLPQGAKLAPAVAAESRFGLELISAAYAADTPVTAATLGWSMPAASLPIIYTVQVPKATCQAYNLVQRGDNGILRLAFETLPAQCYGLDGDYRVVVKKVGTNINLAGVLDSTVEPGNLPSKENDAWWDAAPDGQVKVPVDPVKVPKAELALGGAGPLAFGQLQLGQVATLGPVTVSNRGKVPADGLALEVPVGFQITGSSCGAQLGAGASCIFSVDFAPVAVQSYSGALKASSSNGPTVQTAVSGAGVASSGNLTALLDFGDVPAGQQLVKDAVLSNTGIGPLQLGSATVVGTGFSVAPGGTCAQRLSAGSSCIIKVALTATGVVAHTGALQLVTQELGTLGTGLAGQSRQVVLDVSPMTKDFGSMLVGQSLESVHTVTNSGNLAAAAFTISAPAAPYSVLNSTCAASLAPSASCSFSVKFTPTAVQTYPTNIDITAQGISKQLTFVGKGVTPPADIEYTVAGASTWTPPLAGRYEVIAVGGGGGGGAGGDTLYTNLFGGDGGTSSVGSTVVAKGGYGGAGGSTNGKGDGNGGNGGSAGGGGLTPGGNAAYIAAYTPNRARQGAGTNYYTALGLTAQAGGIAAPSAGSVGGTNGSSTLGNGSGAGGGGGGVAVATKFAGDGTNQLSGGSSYQRGLGGAGYGAGGGGGATQSGWAGGGGGSGYATKMTLTVLAGAQQTVTVGAGGAGALHLHPYHGDGGQGAQGYVRIKFIGP